MPYTDLPLDQLRAYRPALVEPDDLDAFWADTLADARTHPLDATFERVDSGLAVIDTWDVTFRGFGGSPIRGWLHLPAGRATLVRRSSSTSATGAAGACRTRRSSGRQRATRIS